MNERELIHNSKITIKLPLEAKQELFKIANDMDISLSRLIRLCLLNTLEELKNHIPE